MELKYTIGGKLAQRVDQRGVRLKYEYGTSLALPSDEQLTALTADLSNVQPSPRIDDRITRLEFGHKLAGLGYASSWGGSPLALRSNINFMYDEFGNLKEQRVEPGAGSMTEAVTAYQWSAMGQANRNRLEQMVYPSGRRFRIDYGTSATTETVDAINRPTGLTQVGSTGTTILPVATYDYTGGGRKVRQRWGNPAAPTVDLDLDYYNGWDRFGRVSNLTFRNLYPGGMYPPDDVIHSYQYGYDDNGNRLYSRVRQVSFSGEDEDHNNQESNKYTYDRLNRLTSNDYGSLAANFAGGEFIRGWEWTLDLLGNWAGPPCSPTPCSNPPASWALRRREYDAGQQIDSENEQHHIVNQANQIMQRYEGTRSLDQLYDAAGNLIDDDYTNSSGYLYTYDAWNRLVLVTDKTKCCPIAAHEYDALGRRIGKQVTCTSGLNTSGMDRFFYEGHRLIEHWSAGAFTTSGAPCANGVPQCGCQCQPCVIGGPYPSCQCPGGGDPESSKQISEAAAFDSVR